MLEQEIGRETRREMKVKASGLPVAEDGMRVAHAHILWLLRWQRQRRVASMVRQLRSVKTGFAFLQPLIVTLVIAARLSLPPFVTMSIARPQTDPSAGGGYSQARHAVNVACCAQREKDGGHTAARMRARVRQRVVPLGKGEMQKEMRARECGVLRCGFPRAYNMKRRL